MDNLSELHLDGTAIKYLAVGKNHLKCPISINMSGCRNLMAVPVLLNLKSLNLGGCKRILRLPSDSECMVHLEELDASETSITRVHQSYFFLEKVQVLSFCGCKGLQLPKWFSGLTSLTSLNLRRCGLAEEVLDILYCLSSLKILDLGENSFVTIPTGIGCLSFLHRLDLTGNNIVSISNDIAHISSLKCLILGENSLVTIPNVIFYLSSLHLLDLGGNNIVSIPHEIGHLSSLQVLDLSGNNFVSIPDEIGHLSSLQLLDLSDNNFITIPESISRLSELTELVVFRCRKLQSLPSRLPFNLKHVHAQECPMLKNNTDTLTIWASPKRFCFINCTQPHQDDYQPGHFPVPLPKDYIELFYPKYIADRVYGREPFEIRFPQCARIPNLWRHWTSGPSVTIPLLGGNSAFMGFSLFVVFEILQRGNLKKIWESEETICEFHTDIGLENCLVFQNFIDFKAGSYALCCYEPRGGRCHGIFERPSSQLRASVSTKRPDLKVRGCAMHLISEEDTAEFVKCLANQTVTHLDSNFDRHCKYILDEEMSQITSYLMEQGSTSTLNEDSCSRGNLNIQPREELLILYEGRSGREKSFYLCFPAPVTIFPPWFLNHHAGDVTVCQLTENLLDGQTWVGLELYVVFTRPASASSDGDKNFSFHVDFCAYDHQNIVSNGSLKLDSFLGTRDQLVVLHLPRVFFPQWLNQFHGISALFRSIDPEMEVQVCGSRLLFERNLHELLDSLAAAAAGTLGEEHVLAQSFPRAHIAMIEDPIYDTQIVNVRRNKRTTEKRKENAGTLHQGNIVEGANFSSCWFERNTVQVLAEQAPTSSIMRLQKYSCYLQKNQDSVEFNILLHSRGCLLDNKDSNQENVAEDTAPLLSCHSLCMTETQLFGSYSSEEWKRCIELLLQYFKATTISLKGLTVAALKHFNPSSPYNICLSGTEILLWFGAHTSFSSRVGMGLLPKFCDGDSWRGLVICAAFKVHDQHPLTPVVKLLCHLKSKDYCLNPIPMCSINKEKLVEPLYRGGFIWVTYIPRVLLTELRVVSDVEARIYIDGPILTVADCCIRLLHWQEEEEFRKVITGRSTSFLDNLPLIRQAVQADESVPKRKWKGDKFPMPGGHTKEFDRDFIYNATLPTQKIPSWFGNYGRRTATRELEVQLPAPSLCSDKSWIGLALCASYLHPYPAYRIQRHKRPVYCKCRLYTKNNKLSSLHEYQISNEVSKWLKGRHGDGGFIWLSYIPLRWFLHQLNGESVLSVSFYDSSSVSFYDSGCNLYSGAYRFVYEHDVEEFEQLCIDLHQSAVPENQGITQNQTLDEFWSAYSSSHSGGGSPRLTI